MTSDKTKAACSSVPLETLVGLDSADMDIADRLHGYAMLHKGMTPESWAMAEGRDEIVGLRKIVSAQRDLIAALEQVANLSITAMAENARSVFDVAQIERTLKVLAAAKAACLVPNVQIEPPPRLFAEVGSNAGLGELRTYYRERAEDIAARL